MLFSRIIFVSIKNGAYFIDEVIIMHKIPSPGTIRLRKIAYWLIIIAAILVFLIYFQAFLKPFILALVFWYFIRELRALLGKVRIRGKRLTRWMRGIIALLIMLILIGSIIELLATNIEQIIDQLPRYSEIRDRFIGELGESLDMQDMAANLEERLKNIDVANFLTGLLNGLTSTIGNLVMIIIYIIFLLIEEVIFVKKIKLISASNKHYYNIQSLLEQINHYVMMKTLVSIST
jgi:predicted PurR-regulated permease PerM